MIEQILKWVLICISSLWASVYLGSLGPQLWRQKNYKGAIGITIFAIITLVLPIAITILRTRYS